MRQQGTLPATQLPLYKDIGLQVLEFEQTEGLPRDEAIERTAKKVEELYMKASIPTISNHSIKRKIKKLMLLKRAKEQEDLTDNRSGKPKTQGKEGKHGIHRKKKKNI